MRSRFRFVAVLAILATMNACGGSAAPPASGGAAAPTHEETEKKPEKESPAAGVDKGGAATPTMLPWDADMKQTQISLDQASSAFAAANDCASMCKALASMARSTEHLCDLLKGDTSPEQKRCSDAQSKLESARTKVKQTCGGCG